MTRSTRRRVGVASLGASIGLAPSGCAYLMGRFMRCLSPKRRGTRFASVLALTAAASLTFAACGGGSTGTPGGEASGGGGGGEVPVTLITKDNNNPYWISMQKGADAAAAKNGVTLTKAAGANQVTRTVRSRQSRPPSREVTKPS